MLLRLYDSLTRDYVTVQPGSQAVSLYVCGITPYDTTHLGHAFTYTAADIAVRFLESQGQAVRYVQNVTDIDDDILRKAGEVGDDWRSLGNRWTAHFIRDMQALNVRPPDHMPRASDAVPNIIEAVQGLLARGLAYAAGGSVYYAVSAWPDFGALSGLPRDAMLPVANERGNKPDDPHKRDPLDFVLWQAQAPGEPAWDSPWGPGRPGWHIECSTLSLHYLGETIDIHGGGTDLIFPHHEAEIAQAEPLTGRRPFVRAWMHTAMVEHAGAKMSKSLGNLVMMRDLRLDWTADALRLYLGGHHYRQVWAHDEAALAQAARQARRLRQAASAGGGQGDPVDASPALARFNERLADDLDTPAAVEVMLRLADEISAGAQAGRAVAGAQATLRRLAAVFGLRLGEQEPEPHVAAGWAAHLKRFEV